MGSARIADDRIGEKPMKKRAFKYSTEELDWIKARCRKDRKETHAEFQRVFDRPEVKLENFNALCKRNGWLTGRNGRFEKGQVSHNKGKKCPPGKGGRHPNARRHQFKKGGLPHNTKFLGHERVNTEGYVEISVDETNPHTGYERRYVHKHRYLWEKTHGPVPEGMVLKCLDGNKQNCDPANWELISRSLLPYLNGHRGPNYELAEPEVKPAILTIAKIKGRVRELSRDDKAGPL